MSDSASDLEQLRRRIDEIDDRLQDLLNERVELVFSVAARKSSSGGVAAHQPSREAEIIRRLVARNYGGLPPASLVRMWRELLAATVTMQGSFTIAVYAAPEAQGFWDLARDQYGSHTPMVAYGSTGQVIRAVTERQAVIGILPMPREEDPDPWWRQLLSPREDAPHVIARLPFGARGNARSGSDALAIGRDPLQATGRDRTLLAAENAPDISRGRLFSTLSSVGLSCTLMASSKHAEGEYTLIEIDGFVPLADPRIERFRGELGGALYRLLRFGAYAVPLSAAELGVPSMAAFGTPTAAIPAAAKG